MMQSQHRNRFGTTPREDRIRRDMNWSWGTKLHAAVRMARSRALRAAEPCPAHAIDLSGVFFIPIATAQEREKHSYGLGFAAAVEPRVSGHDPREERARHDCAETDQEGEPLDGEDRPPSLRAVTNLPREP
jgi:hypothetical protein